VSESSDTAQASIVFLGRESFRMQVVPEGVPIRAIDMPTERIVDRRQRSERRKRNERRQPRLEPEAPVDEREASPEASIDPWQTRTTAWNRVAVISVATFACGVLLTVAVDHLTRPARARVIPPSEPATAVAPMPPPPAEPQPPAAPAVVVVQPLPQTIVEPAAPPAPAPAVTPAPASASPIDLRPRKLHAVAKAPAVRPPRSASAKPPAAQVKPTEPPPMRPTRKWVDPFAE